MQKKSIITVCVMLLVVGIIFALLTLKSKISNTNSINKISVVTSFYPLYYFTSEIGKNYVSITNLTPSGAEPHDYEPSTQDILTIQKSKLLIINGAGLEPWVEKLTSDLAANHIKTIAVADTIADRSVVAEGQTQQDPHIWLDPVLAKTIASRITQALIDIDADHTIDYQKNATILEQKLDALDKNFKETLVNCKQKNIITAHAAFGYMAQQYGFTQVALTGLSPDQEPSPQTLAVIADQAKKDSIKYIFFESLVSPRLADTIAKEIGAQTLVFNPLEGLTPEEVSRGEDYFSVQQENLKTLKIALECQ